MLNWLLKFFPSKRAPCIACDHIYAKDAMKELWYRYTEEDGFQGTSSTFICQPCLDEIAQEIEDGIRQPDPTDFDEYGVYDDDRL
ncbi:hypothetical protein PHIM7_25 [Sinorhizobium phage phiM7]|uniref:Uncharacterized protein n=3 Tax=Emdodecavirus TaxID=1980937 RepID=S5MPC2_9CAUD|nr:hypothetical protein AB690_gp030 [Sinorhizobium phage phiM12]YP_009212280.1 hypothetical protein AVT40_gp040 [Sinorhizobium phage phiN3]YP_009601150.1 hypothetical protein FDH46_gp025 [Sinorhizobium phage phiM7]AKF12933.1 hypothetical protein PHIM19_26 [Sinorhizobium phage phiM19]AGR47670.1 hypothetical protein SmphiM12_038 [Sinorhizobium phage phiM12]AKF12573.1 hypothetical protein PHIM7_25 [Sinorhizobium phage phiM7]AKF13305.1 hypothetical protein PHIN3_40 [Sinorhizobium phage phiN3]